MLVREASRRLQALPPELHGYLGEIESLLSTLYSAAVPDDQSIAGYRGESAGGSGDRVAEILREAEKAAAEKVAKRLGEEQEPRL
jgi:pyruvoyl-dependent arginine decarboxylase (PvlArgDC)